MLRNLDDEQARNADREQNGLEWQIAEEVRLLNEFDPNTKSIAEFEIASLIDFKNLEE